MSKQLIICRDAASASLLRRIARSDRPVALASDDPRVHAIARGSFGTDEIHFVEKGGSVFTVADSVLPILEEIDAYLTSLDQALPPEILSWGKNVEGGLTNQRVQDVCLLINSYFDLFAEVDATEVHLLSNHAWLWEDRVLVACARTLGIPVFSRTTNGLKARARKIWAALLPWARGTYYIGHEILRGLRIPLAENKMFIDRAVIFQVCSSTRKHLENVSAVMAALQDRGQAVVALCWSAAERFSKRDAAAQLEDQGLRAIRLEQYSGMLDVVSSLWRSIRIALRTRQPSERWGLIQFKGVCLAPLLAESLRDFLIAELPRRLRYASALSRAVNGAHPVAIKPWGGANMFEGKLLLRLTRDRQRPLFIHYWLGVSIEWPYAEREFVPDVFLAKSDHEAWLAAREFGIDAGHVRVVGSTRLGHYKNLTHETSPANSRSRLGIPEGFQYYIGLDPNAVIRGYLSSREQIGLAQALADIATECPRAMVVVKPHPSYAIEHLQLHQPARRNLIVLPRHADADHFINAVDMLITKYSHLILEAALIGRPAISVITDGEFRFKVFGDIPQTVTSYDQLKALIKGLVSSDARFQAWKREQTNRATMLLSRYYRDPPGGSPAAAAEAIMEAISSRKTQSVPLDISLQSRAHAKG